MSNNHDNLPQSHDGVLLCGLDGTNPLGFLASLGTLQTLTEANRTRTVTLAWQSHDCSWVPVIHGIGGEKTTIAAAIAQQLRCPFRPDQQRDQKRADNQEVHEAKKRQLKQAVESLKKRALHGNQRKETEERELGPLRHELAGLRCQWLTALRESVPSLEISLGKHLNASCDELRYAMLTGLEEASSTDRAAIDFFAAFGSDVCAQPKGEQMQATPFCFITGSGHQYFLDTVRQLMEQVDAQRLEEALFSPTEPSDEKLSMRWDPQEDRRYAVMWSDPTASDNKAKTNWAINLLGYRGLQLCYSAPSSRELRTTGWYPDPQPTWRWPIWKRGLPVDVVRSTLSHPSLMNKNPSRALLSAIGVAALYQSRRVQVGNPPLHKVNFTPAHQIA
jgi:hypothetical protein